MELSLHAPLGPVVLHLHPILANAFLCALGGRKALEEIFRPAFGFVILPYAAPGIEIGTLLWNTIAGDEARSAAFPVFLLENHGIVVQGESAAQVIQICDKALALGAAALPQRGGFPPFDPCRAEECIPAEILRAIREAAPELPCFTAFRRDGASMKGEPIGSDCLFPDTAVYCGGRSVNASDPATVTIDVEAYRREWGHVPKVFRCQEGIVAAGRQETEARFVAEVWWAQETVRDLSAAVGGARRLSEKQVRRVLGLESEKYRQGMAGGP